MGKYLVQFLAFSLLISCSDNPTQYEYVSDKVKSEIWYRLNTTEIIKNIQYEYYRNGKLKRKTESYPGNVNNTLYDYFYNDELKPSVEIVSCGSIYSDTLYFSYDSNNLLIQKQTVHSTANFINRDTVFYFYNSSGKLSEWYKKDPYSQYSSMNRETYEYSNDLLSRINSYINDELLRTYEYRYSNNLKIEELIYSGNNGLLEHRSEFYYRGNLLINIKGYFADETEWSDQIIYEYTDNDKLIKMTVYVPPISSFVNHEIHYKY